MARAGAREKRVAERIRTDITDLITRGDLRDPALEGVIVSDVQVTNDLSLARVFVRVLEGSDEVDAGRKKALLAALGRAAGFLRRELAATLEVRRVPELRFGWDDAADRAGRLDEIFEEIRREQEKKP